MGHIKILKSFVKSFRKSVDNIQYIYYNSNCKEVEQHINIK